MLSRVSSKTINIAYPSEVEMKAPWGNAIVANVGLPELSTEEKRNRVVDAIKNSSVMRSGSWRSIS